MGNPRKGVKAILIVHDYNAISYGEVTYLGVIGNKRMRWLIGFSLVVAFWASFQQAGQAQMIVAHRGASFVAPENTLASFREAWDQKADVIEGDFYLTKDGHIVCIHDKTTNRTTGGMANVNVTESNLADLRDLDVGSWKHQRYAGERIPVLEEVLATVPRTGKIFIEIKSGVEIVEPLRVILEKSNLQSEQMIIICFDETVITKCREKMPQLKASWLTSYKKKGRGDTWSPSLATVLATLKRTNATGLGTQANDEVVTANFVKSLRKAGVECHVWTVNDAAQAKRFADLGFDSITTDKPAHIRQAVFGKSE